MRNKKKVTITVGIPTFNRLQILKKTIESVLAQTEKPDEVIVSDNCSTDGVWEYLKEIPGIKASRNRKNIGATANYNRVLELAKSDYVLALGSDDIVLPDYIKVWKEKIGQLSGREVMALTSAGYIIDENDRITGIIKPFSYDQKFCPPQTIKAFWDSFYFFNLQTSFWTIYKKELFEKIGYFTPEYNRIIDAEMTIKILCRFPIYYCAKPLGGYRIHPLQAIEDTNPEREFSDRRDSSRLLYSFEKKPEVLSSFTKKEQKQRLFIRKPLIYLLIAAIFYGLKGNFWRAKKYWRVFSENYPRPIVSWLLLRLVLEWLLFLFYQLGRNLAVKLKFKNKKIFSLNS